MLCFDCDVVYHENHAIHNRSFMSIATGGYSPLPVPQRTWRLQHCPSCFHPQPRDDEGKEESAERSRSPVSEESGETGDASEPLSKGTSASSEHVASHVVNLHTASSGVVVVKIIEGECTACGFSFGANAAFFGCTPCGTDSYWFEDELLESMALLNEATSCGIPMSAMFASHSAKCVVRGNAPLTSSDALNLNEALRIYSALRNDRLRLGRIAKESIERVTAVNSDCPYEVAKSLSLLRVCAACGSTPLCATSDGSTCCRTRHSAGFSHGLPLIDSVLGDLFVDEENGDLQSGPFIAFQKWKEQTISKKRSRPRKKPAAYHCLDTNGDIRDNDAFSRMYRRTMLFQSACPHYVVNEKTGIWVRTGERLELLHYQASLLLHNSGIRPLPEVFGEVPPYLEPMPAHLYYDNTCNMKKHLEIADAEALRLLPLFLGKLHQFAHGCRNRNAGAYNALTADVFGEEMETVWAHFKALGKLTLPMAENKSLELLTLLTANMNDASDARVPALMTDRAHLSLLRLCKEQQNLVELTKVIKSQFDVDLKERDINEWRVSFGMADTDTTDIEDKSLDLKARLAGAKDEYEMFRACAQAQDACMLYDSERLAIELKHTKARMRKSADFVAELQAQLPEEEQGYEPSAGDLNEYRRYRHNELQVTINEKESLILHFLEKFKRGHNQDFVFTCEKAEVRKKVEKYRRQIEHAKLQQERNGYSADAATAFQGQGSEGSKSIPSELKLDVVNGHAVLCRASEALGFQIKHELQTYCKTHEERAAALIYAADYLGNQEDGSTRVALGVSVELREAAARHRNLATRGRVQLQLLPGLPPPYVDQVTAAPWIQREIQKAAQMQAEFQSKRMQDHAMREEKHRAKAAGAAVRTEGGAGSKEED